MAGWPLAAVDQAVEGGVTGAPPQFLSNLFLLVPLAAILGGLAAWIHLVTDEKNVPMWRAFLVGPAFLVSFSLGFLTYGGVLQRAMTGGAVPMVIGGLVFFGITMALVERGVAETAIYLFWWLLASTFAVGLLGAVWRLFT